MQRRSRWWWLAAASPIVVLVLASLLWRRDATSHAEQTVLTPTSPPLAQATPSLILPEARTVASIDRDNAAPPEKSATAPQTPYASEEGFDWYSLDELNEEVGVLVGRVLRGTAPLEGARIALWPRNPDGWPPLVDTPPLLTTSSDHEGRFRFDKLTSGKYRLRAEHDGEFVEHPTVPFEQGSRRVIYLVFGSSVIDGHVFDEQGLPRARECVRVTGWGPSPHRAVWAHTDTNGFFRCAGLLAGKYNVQIEQGDDWDANWDRMIELGVGDHATLSFGRVRNTARWTGRIVDAQSEVVPVARRIFLRHTARKDTLRFPSAADGSFAFELGDGEWTAYTATNSRSNRELGSVKLFGRDTEHDLVLPGIRLVIEIVAEGPGESATRFRDIASQSLRLSSGPEDLMEPERVGATHVQWCLLEPHGYELITMNLPRIADSELLGPEAVRAAPDQPPRALRVELRSDEPVRRMQLRMTSAPWGKR